MSLYGILHIPTGNFVHAAFFLEGRYYDAFEEEFIAWVANNARVGAVSDSLFGFYILPHLSKIHVDNACITPPTLFACSKKSVCNKIIGFDNFKEQISMDIYGLSEWEDFCDSEHSQSLVTRAEFSVVPLDMPGIKSIDDYYAELPSRHTND